MIKSNQDVRQQGFMDEVFKEKKRYGVFFNENYDIAFAPKDFKENSKKYPNSSDGKPPVSIGIDLKNRTIQFAPTVNWFKREEEYGSQISPNYDRATPFSYGEESQASSMMSTIKTAFPHTSAFFKKLSDKFQKHEKIEPEEMIEFFNSKKFLSEFKEPSLKQQEAIYSLINDNYYDIPNIGKVNPNIDAFQTFLTPVSMEKTEEDLSGIPKQSEENLSTVPQQNTYNPISKSEPVPKPEPKPTIDPSPEPIHKPKPKKEPKKEKPILPKLLNENLEEVMNKVNMDTPKKEEPKKPLIYNDDKGYPQYTRSKPREAYLYNDYIDDHGIYSKRNIDAVRAERAPGVQKQFEDYQNKAKYYHDAGITNEKNLKNIQDYYSKRNEVHYQDFLKDKAKSILGSQQDKVDSYVNKARYDIINPSQQSRVDNYIADYNKQKQKAKTLYSQLPTQQQKVDSYVTQGITDNVIKNMPNQQLMADNYVRTANAQKIAKSIPTQQDYVDSYIKQAKANMASQAKTLEQPVKNIAKGAVKNPITKNLSKAAETYGNFLNKAIKLFGGKK